MSTTRILIFSILSLSAICSSNLDCILEKLSSPRRLSSLVDPIVPIKEYENKIYTNLLGRFASIFKDSHNKHNEKEYKPITEVEAITELIATTTLVLSDGQRRFSGQICVPYLMELGIDRSVSVYFCEHLISGKNSHIKFLVENSDVAGTYFGHIFQTAASDLPITFFPSSLANQHNLIPTYRLKQEFNTRYQKDVLDLLKNFSKGVDEYFKKNVDEILVQKFKKELGLEKFVKDIFGKSKNDLGAKVNKLTLAFNMNLNGQSKGVIAQYKGLLKEFVDVLSEDVTSNAFRQLHDKVLSLVDPKRESYSILRDNYLSTQCYETLAKFNLAQPIHICRMIIKSSLELDPTNKPTFDALLNSPHFMRVVNHFIQKNLLAYKLNRDADLDTVSENIKKDIMDQVTKVQRQIRQVQAIYPNSEPQVFAPLLWDLRRFGDRHGRQTFEFLQTIGAFEIYANDIRKSVHSAKKIHEIIEDAKKSLFKYFKTSKQEIKEDEFRSKLIEQCDIQIPGIVSKICAKGAAVVNVSKRLTALRHSSSVYKFMVQMLQTHLEKYDTDLNNEFALIGVAAEFLRASIHSLDSELDELDRTTPEDIKKIKSKKIARLFVEAKLVNLELQKNFTLDVSPIFESWIKINSDEIDTYNLKDTAFDVLAGRLADTIRSSFADEISFSQLSNSIDDMRMSLKHHSFDHNSLEIRAIKANLYTIIKHFDSFPSQLKTELLKCQLNDHIAEALIETCSKINNRECVKTNPFLASPLCPPGHLIGLFGKCTGVCPEGFQASGSDYCAKPQMELAEFVIGKPGSAVSASCKPNFARFGFMCMPQCPKTWEDHGNWCKKPEFKYGISEEVLLIK